MRANGILNKLGKYNFEEKLVKIPSNFNFEYLHRELKDYCDKEVIDLMQYGFPVGHNGKTGSREIPKNHKGAELYPEQMRNILQKEVDFKSVLGPFTYPPFEDACYSPLNSVPKRGNQRRLILDMSYPPGNSINDGIEKDVYLDIQKKLELPSIDKLVQRIKQLGKGCKMFKIDLVRAYRQVYCCPKDVQLLGYVYNKKFYHDCTLSMGSRSSARSCQRVSSVVVFIHTKFGYFAINYLDDIGGAELAELAEEAFAHLQHVLHSIGLKEAVEKTVRPCTCMTFLGIEVNSITMTISIPADKWSEIQVVIDEWLKKNFSTLNEVQKLAGLLNFACKCVKSGRVYLSRILNFLRSFGANKFCTRKVTTIVRKDIMWWKEMASHFNGISLITDAKWSKPDEIISSDSCLVGGGAFLNGKYMHFSYPAKLKKLKLDINQLECMMVIVALKKWAEFLARKKVQLFCDNQTTVAVLNSASSKNVILQNCLRELHKLEAIFSFEVKLVYLPGESNRISDALSRWELDKSFQVNFFKWTSEFTLEETEVQMKDWEFILNN